jgi:D-glycero-D-manno-heptose 1,7-bisphosphate phosphatase
LLFLDRDGTLNRALGSRPPNVPEEVELLPGVESVLPGYVADGWQLVIVTNQGGVASGYLTEAQAHAVQQQVIDLLPVPVTASYLCPHMPGGVVAEYAIDCPNRKPRPGFILSALQAFGARAEDCLFVGDAITDQQVAQAGGVPCCWADRFFGRPIDRGLHTRESEWVQVREVKKAGDEGEKRDRWEFCLQAIQRGRVVGGLAVLWEHLSNEANVIDVMLDVRAMRRRAGIDSLLVETALEWANEQPGLGRSLLQKLSSDLPGVLALSAEHLR